MRGHHMCPKCEKSLASRQSLWNHKQRCATGGQVTPVSKIDSFLDEISTPEESDLVEKFISLFREYWLDKEYKNHEEILSVLEKLYEKGDISKDTYRRVYTLMALSDEGDNFTHFEHLIARDKGELQEVLRELRTEDTEHTINYLEQLIEDYLRGENIVPQIHALLEGKLYHMVPKSQIYRIKILLKNIARIRDRVDQIVNIFRQTPADKESRLVEFKRMLRQELISMEQYLKLVAAVDEIDMEDVMDIVQRY